MTNTTKTPSTHATLLMYCKDTAEEWADLALLLDRMEVDEDDRSAYTALSDGALDIVDYSRRGEWLGSRITVALGGPSIYVDTCGGEVIGNWGGTVVTVPVQVDEAILDALEELYGSNF